MKSAGFQYYPTSAVVTLCATSSAVCSVLCRPLVSAREDLERIETAAAFFFLVALVTSATAGCALLFTGSEELGTLVIRGREIPPHTLRIYYWLLFLFPWLAVAALLARI